MLLTKLNRGGMWLLNVCFHIFPDPWDAWRQPPGKPVPLLYTSQHEFLLEEDDTPIFTVTVKPLHLPADCILCAQCLCFRNPWVFGPPSIFISIWKSRIDESTFWQLLLKSIHVVLTQNSRLPEAGVADAYIHWSLCVGRGTAWSLSQVVLFYINLSYISEYTL